MEKNYLFIKNEQIIYDLKNINYTDVHFWNTCHIENQQPLQNVYFYCKTIEEINFVLTNNYIPHITFVGDSIFSSFYDATSSYDVERFWLPEKKHLNNDFIHRFLSLPNIEHTPIAITFNPIFQPDITYEEFFLFIKKLNSKYVNPLFLKDLILQENESFSLNNSAIIDGKQYYVVLGLFGDYYSLEKPTDKSMSLGILKDKQCVTCDFAVSCKERGLGILKYDNNIQSCVGIKLFQQN